MHNILHASLKPENELALKNIIEKFTEIKVRGYKNSFNYDDLVKNNDPRIQRKKIDKKNEKTFIEKETFIEREMNEEFSKTCSKPFIHSACRDTRKVIKRFKNKKNILQSNQVYFEADNKKNNSLVRIENDTLYIQIGQDEIKGKLEFFNLKKHPNFSKDKPFGIRIIKRIHTNRKIKWKDKYHVLIDYEDGRELLEPDYSNGCVAIDMNYENVALTDVDENGNLLKHKIFVFKNIINKKMVQMKDEEKRNALIKLFIKVMKYCKKVNKPLICEHLADGSINKGGKFKKNGGYNNKFLCRFPRGMFQKEIERQAIKYKVSLIIVSAKYTSRIGVIKYQLDLKKKFPYIHEGNCAAYVIARRGLFLGKEFISKTKWKNVCFDKSKELKNKEKYYEWKVKTKEEQIKLEESAFEKDKPVIKFNNIFINEDISYKIAEKMISNTDEKIKKIKISENNFTNDPFNIYRVLYFGSGQKNNLTKNCKTIIKFFDFLNNGNVNKSVRTKKDRKDEEKVVDNFMKKYNIKEEIDIVNNIDNMYNDGFLKRK